MATKAKERAYKMTLAQFHRYLNDKRLELGACYNQLDQIRDELTEVFKREMAAWQETFAYCYPQLKAQREEMPTAFAKLIDRTEAEEQARIRREITDLEREVKEGKARMDALTADAQAATDALRAANPELDTREEALKRRVVRLQNEFTEAFEQEQALRSSPGATLSHYAKIRRLVKLQKTIKKQQAQTLERIHQTRKKWESSLEETGDVQAKLRSEWQEIGVRVSQAQGRHDRLQTHFETLAEEAGRRRVLEELSEAPNVSGEFGEALKDLAARNKVRWAYEDALSAVAEALGLTQGMGKGMRRFQTSVSKVLGEQRRYNLAQIQVRVPRSAAMLNQIWKQVTEATDDKKYMVAHPKEFAAIVEQQVVKRLTNETIQDFFEQMGKALNRATSAWG